MISTVAAIRWRTHWFVTNFLALFLLSDFVGTFLPFLGFPPGFLQPTDRFTTHLAPNHSFSGGFVKSLLYGNVRNLFVKVRDSDPISSFPGDFTQPRKFESLKVPSLECLICRPRNPASLETAWRR